MINGIINVYKERGYTSHDVVAKLRGIFHQKKIGHTGTLDPDAEGVLLVCLGKATGICGMLTDWNKTYEAVMLLGTRTDTQDISGTVLETLQPETDTRKILDVIDSFIGEQQQIPPMYSALKVNGRKLYELAREGVEIDRKARTITINSIRVNEINVQEHTVRMTVECSKGTYIRTLCNDIGAALGCGACMAALKRTAVGVYNADDAVTLGQIQAKVLLGDSQGYIIPADSVFENIQPVIVQPVFNMAVHNGNRIPWAARIPDSNEPDTVTDVQSVYPRDYDEFRIYDSDNNFIGIYRYDGGMLTPVKMFYDGE